MRLGIAFAGLCGAMAVGFAAYSAHGLAGDPRAQGLADRAAQYQLFHALALLAADRLAAEGRRLARLAFALFAAGIVLFSGSLYVKALMGAMPVPLVTPAGGIAFILGWLALAGCARDSKGT
jgi:uncharacterized membrane protein YgdD (TMEM256/DUF423 family)